MSAICIRLASVSLEVGIGVLAWRRPDPTAGVSPWRRAVLRMSLYAASGFLAMSKVLP